MRSVVLNVVKKYLDSFECQYLDRNIDLLGIIGISVFCITPIILAVLSVVVIFLTEPSSTLNNLGKYTGIGIIGVFIVLMTIGLFLRKFYGSFKFDDDEIKNIDWDSMPIFVKVWADYLGGISCFWAIGDVLIEILKDMFNFSLMYKGTVAIVLCLFLVPSFMILKFGLNSPSDECPPSGLSGDYRWLEDINGCQVCTDNQLPITWNGDCSNGKMEGVGKLEFGNGHIFKGSIEKGKYHGQGTYTWPSGDKYVGQFKDHFFDGQATYTFKDGGKYIGPYRKGKKMGKEL